MKSVTVIRKTVFAASLTVLVMGLSACGSKGNVQTVDDSADYQGARALPPLKKPTRVIATAAESASENDTVVSSTAEQATTAEPVLGSPNQSLVESNDNEPAQQAVLETPAVETSAATVSARVVNDDDLSVLELDTEFDSAWDYMTQSLQKSDVTVFARNKVAGRFSIGCTGIEDDVEADDAPKKGRWSFFSRERREYLEYCALQVEEKRGKTLVSVLDRSGLVVATSRSNALFNRILNN